MPAGTHLLLAVVTALIAHVLGENKAIQSPSSHGTTWPSQQGECSNWFHTRAHMTPEDQQTVQLQLQNEEHLHSGSDRRSVLPDNGTWCPALLWTYTGTGNTMTRMLIEAASGWYTGSVYTDLSLVDIMPGEYVCDSSVIAVKAHPQWHSFPSLSHEGFRPDTPGVPPDAKDICPCNFTRAVAVIRDPYATFLAEYKRLRTHDYSTCSHGTVKGQACAGGHVSVLPKATFNASDFRLEALRMADEWVAMFQSYDAFAAAHPRGLHLTTFENLTDLNSRTQTLVEILQVLGVPAHSRKGVYSSLEAAAGPSVEGTCSAAMTDVLATQACTAAPADDAAPSVLSPVRRTEAAAASVPSSGQQKPYQPQYNSARLQCAFDLAQHPSIYRPKDPQGIDMSFVYHNEASLVCEIWEVVHSRAAAFGYKPFGGISC